MAQTDTGSIGGYVKDPSGRSVPKATVTIRNEGTNEVHTLTTNDSGYYIQTQLPPGMYTVSAEAPGFKRFESKQNKLDSNTALSLDAALTVGNVSETVEVAATAEVLQTDSSAVQTEIPGKQVDMQELNGRNPLYIAQLLPGMRSGSTMGDFNFAVGGGVPFNVNGARPQDTDVTFDGAPAVRTRANGAIIGVANVDSTEEIQVLTADYSPEYGRAAGGQIRIVSKSGTRDFHGSLYEYLRNSDMNANTWSRNLSSVTGSTQAFRYNNFGGTIGGPIWAPGMKDWFRQKFFFFVGEDEIRYRYEDYSQEPVPTQLMRQGNFSELLNPNPWYSGSHIIYDPTTCPKVGAASCQPFPNNTIPVNRLSPNGIAMINAYPLPTPGFQNGSNNWIAQAEHPINQRKETINVDMLLNEKNRLSGRRTDASYFEYQPFDQNLGLTGKYFKRPNQTNVASLTSTISPTLVNEAIGSLSIDDVYIPVNTSLAGFNRGTLCAPITGSCIDFPYILPNGKDIPTKIPTVNVPNFSSLAGGPYPSHSSGTIWTFGDTVTKVWQNHTIKAGFSAEYSGENDGDQINVSTVPGGASDQNGTFTFTDARTGFGATSGIGMANLALGLADAYTEIGPRALTIWRSWMLEGFAQDSWKVTPKLHVEYGVRWTQVQGQHPLWGNADYFDGALYNPAQAVTLNSSGNVILGTGNPYNGVVIPGINAFPSAANGRVAAATSNQCDGASCGSLFDPSLPKGYIQTQNVFQPRVGIAYELNGSTVIRAGAGSFVTRMVQIDNIFPGGNSPFQPFLTVTNVSVDNPGAGLTNTIAAPLTMTTLNPNLKPPKAYNWNFTVQRKLFWQSLLSVAYVAHHGNHGWQVYDINQPSLSTVLANPGVSPSLLRPYKGFAAIQEEESVVNSMYNSLQVYWHKEFTNGSSFGVTYTLSKSMDNGSNYRDIVPDTYNTSNLWGPSEYDERHIVLINYIYAIPLMKTNKWLGGWSLAGTAQFQTGTPCGVGVNNDYAGVGEFGSFGCGSEGQFWVMNGPVQIDTGAFAGPTGNLSNGAPRYFTGNFSAPPAGTFNLQQGVRDSIYGPGFQDWNLSLFKTFRVNERAAFQFRAEAYDFINHPNLAAPSFTATSGTFGIITSKTGLQRTLQLSLRFSF
ncbi:MAG TPA: carboxypeptidase regulatory-like domain-containing protein [Bryobacteraceae bacterium]|nr:carboxypeptidase regulatory-like domain-containing protein [Bryobacteraceae bacterium]